MGNCHNGCGCNRLESTAVTVSPAAMIVTVIPLQTYYDYKFYTLDLCLALPPRTGVEPVSVTDGVGTFPLTDTNGQPVVSGQLRGHKRYRIRFGAGGALSTGSVVAHFTVYDGLCCMEYSANAALQTPSEEG